MTAPEIVARRIGAERQPIAIVDHFHPDPDGLRAAAAHAAFEPGRNHYPGVRAALPDDYFARIRPALTTVLAGVFAHRGAVSLIDASFSMVTLPPERLSRTQRLPHIDALAPDRIALVHYLSPHDSDGTAFFRHRATGFETIDSARSAQYLAALNAEMAARGDAPTGYITSSTPLFERITQVDARYTRCVLYRSALLHSGAIAPDAALSDDPARGRLTVTAFLSIA